jgi:hypothetical protein
VGFANPLAALNRALPAGISTLPPRVLAHTMAIAPRQFGDISAIYPACSIYSGRRSAAASPSLRHFRVFRRLPVLQRQPASRAEARTVVPIPGWREGASDRPTTACRSWSESPAPSMFVVTEAEAAAIRAAFEQRRSLSGHSCTNAPGHFPALTHVATKFGGLQPNAIEPRSSSRISLGRRYSRDGLHVASAKADLGLQSRCG